MNPIRLFYFTDMLLSLVGLSLTVLIYLSLKELRSRQDKCLMCFSSTLGGFYAIVYATNTFWTPRDVGCTFCYYFFMFLSYSSLLWIHAMSFDVYRAIR